MSDNLSQRNALLSPEAVEQEIRRLSRRSFTTAAVAALAGASGVGWLATRPVDDGVPWPLRRILEFNEQVAQAAFDARRLAPEFAASEAVEPRVNGRVGLMSPAAVNDWTVTVTGKVDRKIPLAAIKQLPSYEMTTEFKCVEGWSRIVSWKGVRVADFLAKYGAPSTYVGLSTPPDAVAPDGQPDRYVVGLDRPSAMHPQTLLCYEMNGAPLTHGHGAPLRLVSSVKYGYKSIKRISVIEIAEQRPADYWAQRGYDWYAGH
ncbi:MAG TPA: molybdopterin-dependent oxidoreductase [Pirellulales bacterium]|jgi:DMSO/TMAO reductase YedYZ molybdopterin-dependent catalytic subunit